MTSNVIFARQTTFSTLYSPRVNRITVLINYKSGWMANLMTLQTTCILILCVLIRDAILTFAQKPTRVSLIYRTGFNNQKV